MTAPKDQYKDLPALSVRRPYLAAVINLLIIIAGISAIFGVEVRELPDVDRPIVTTDSGVTYEDLLLGNGAVPIRGQTLAIGYVCTLPDGTEIDSTYSRGQNYRFVFGESFPEGIDQGIEGRLVLAFVVEPTGRPSDIEVLHSLHPLCDSAAVDALRKTRFIPGKQNGRVVRVRMRLPVRFRPGS